MAVKKFVSLENLTEYDGLIKGEIKTGDAATLESANSYTDSKVSNITSGTIVVKEAEHADSSDEAGHAGSADHAESADSATKATQDGDGKVITSTYETKTDASAKLTEAKTYTDTSVDELAANVAYIDDEDNENVVDDNPAANIIVDSALSTTSTNPVQNKVITNKLNELSNEIDDLKEIRDAFETVEGSSNILDPSNSESGYYDLDLAKVNSVNHARTIVPIPLVKKTGKIYYTTNIPSVDTLSSCNLLMFALDENGNKLVYKVNKLSEIALGTIKSYILPAGCTQLHLYISGVNVYGYTFENVCISEVEITEYEPYTGDGNALGRLKDEYAPDTSNKPLKDKVIVNFGDSIFGKRRPPEDISTRLAELTGATVHNCGFGGCRMAKHSMSNYDAFSMYRLADSIVSKDWTLQDNGIVDTSQAEAVPIYFSEGLAILKQLDFSKVDIITIAYGTNDFTAGVNIENTDDAYDINVFAGALRYSVEKLLTAYPHLKIFVCSQTYRFWMDSNNAFTDDSDTHVNADSVKLTDFVAKTKEIAEDYHLPYINNYDIGMNKYNRGYYFPVNDGTHPLTTGCHLIAEHIAKELF